MFRLFRMAPAPACSCGKRMIRLRRGVPVFVCTCGALKLGENTLTVDGATHLLKWRTTSGVPAQAGDVGMDLASGRLQMFVGGAARPVAHTGELAGSHFEYVGQLTAVNTDLVLNPAITDNQSLLIDCIATWAATAQEKILLRVRVNGSYDSDGYFYATWGSGSTALSTVNNASGIGVIWRDNTTTERYYYAHGLLRCLGTSGVRYLGLSYQTSIGAGFDFIRTNSGFRSSFLSASIDGLKFEPSGGSAPSSFVARVWRVKT